MRKSVWDLEIRRIRRINEVLSVAVIILAIALIAQWAFYQKDMATLQQYHEQYGGLKPAPSIYEEHVRV